jgi:hypothetical protein
VILRVAYASCYVYSPAGESALCARSRLLRALLKAGDARFMRRYALRVSQQTRSQALLGGFFHDRDLLVPVPGSAATRAGTWAAAQLAEELVREGLGCGSWHGLQRSFAVRKSATAARGMRPSVALHFESLRMSLPAPQPASVVLIDDVITTGRTLLAAAARASEMFPQAQIRAFALLRTLGLVSDIARVLEPCRGEIRWTGSDARRTP